MTDQLPGTEVTFSFSQELKRKKHGHTCTAYYFKKSIEGKNVKLKIQL